MRHTAQSRFAITSWDEKPSDEGPELPRLTRAVVAKRYTGDLDGEGRAEYLMMYRMDGTATFVGLERFTGRLAGRAGTFVLRRTGVFEDGQAKESYAIVAGSGTEGLHGVQGEGRSAVGHGLEHPFVLDYELA